MKSTSQTAQNDDYWTYPRVDTLKRLWGDGLSASQIANILGDGATRCAVLGKVHRLGLSKRGPSSQGSPYNRPQKYRGRVGSKRNAAHETAGIYGLNALSASEIVALPNFECDPPIERCLKFLDLEAHHCRWPVGEDGHFCGQQKAEGKSYCVGHCSVAYRGALRINVTEPIKHHYLVKKGFRKGGDIKYQRIEADVRARWAVE